MREEKYKCGICKAIIINDIAYRIKNIGYICDNCKNNLEAVIIKDGKFLVEKSFIENIFNNQKQPLSWEL
jgi:hypothetical protein